MSRSFTLTDLPALDDLQTFLARAARIEDGSVRLVAANGVLAVYVAIFYPVGLTDDAPTVLGLRVARISSDDTFDAVVPLAALRQRLENVQADAARAANPELFTATLTLPMEAPSVTWAAISPPRGGWAPIGSIDARVLDAAARAGIDQVAEALPDGAGEQIVRTVRTEVWGREIPGAEHIPAGAAFAALSLGFLGGASLDGAAPVEVFETGTWTRLSSPRGHVLVKRRAWTLSR
ncbi:MAG: hypothetical protein CMF56_09855 [Leifsonia sp.]|nr:hypothetical protein [Leifsonia sp.]|tara:strand:+ start:62763 stop:63467 length:705 start_codon:yes stop_codon:yes gene_type:complete